MKNYISDFICCSFKTFSKKLGTVWFVQMYFIYNLFITKSFFFVVENGAYLWKIRNVDKWHWHFSVEFWSAMSAFVMIDRPEFHRSIKSWIPNEPTELYADLPSSHIINFAFCLLSENKIQMGKGKDSM